MNKMNKLKIAFIAVAVTAASAVTVWAASYDSTEDPLVTLSYLTNIFQPKIERSITTTEEELRQEIAALKALIGTDDSGSTAAAQADSYEVLYLLKGEQILAESQCELILRSGSAQIVSPFADQGIADLTEGTELYTGTALQKNHLLLVPRGGDGRGTVVTSDAAYIMVRGEYSIVKP